MYENTCCFTGHRKIPPEEQPELISKLEALINSLYQSGVRCFKAGGALGFDTLAARAVLDLRRGCPDAELVLVLPCFSQAKGWQADDAAEYERIRAQADRVIYTSQERTRGCMYKRNRCLVEGSGVCVCYLTKNRGGTAYTVGCAERHGLKIINIAANCSKSEK